MQHRTVFPFILVGLTLTLLLVVLAASVQEEGNPQESSADSNELEDQLNPVDQAEYESDVLRALDVFEENGSSEAAYNALVSMRVPSVHRDAHLELVLLFVQAQQDGDLDVDRRLAELKQTYAWLNN